MLGFLRRVKSHARWRLQQLRVLQFKVALFVVRHRFGLALLDDYRRDRAWGGWSGGTRINSRAPGVNYFSSTHYYELDRIFSHVPIGPDDVLVDFGCGRGRVLNFWLSIGLLNKMVGLELDAELAEEAAQRLKNSANVSIIAGDGLSHLPGDGTLCWLFNPFTASNEGRELMQDLEARLRGTGARLVLWRPRHLDVFEGPGWQVEVLDLGLFYRTALILPRPCKKSSPAASQMG